MDYNNEELIKLYSTTKDEMYLISIFENNKNFIHYCRRQVLKRLSAANKTIITEKVVGLDINDVIQAGFLGLIEAINKFDSEKGVKLLTYASYYIMFEMMQCLKREMNYKFSTQSLEYDSDLEIDSYDILMKYDIENMIKNSLEPLEQKVTMLHYGFNDGTEYSTDEINKRLNICNAKYVIQRSLKKLRNTETAQEYKKQFYEEKLLELESRNSNPEIKVIKKIYYENILENL